MSRVKQESIVDKDFEAFKQKVGKRIRELRVQKGFSNYENFAFENGIARAQYGKYEKGTEDLRLSSLYKVLKALNITFEEFFHDLK